MFVAPPTDRGIVDANNIYRAAGERVYQWPKNNKLQGRTMDIAHTQKHVRWVIAHGDATSRWTSTVTAQRAAGVTTARAGRVHRRAAVRHRSPRDVSGAAAHGLVDVAAALAFAPRSLHATMSWAIERRPSSPYTVAAIETAQLAAFVVIGHTARDLMQVNLVVSRPRSHETMARLALVCMIVAAACTGTDSPSTTYFQRSIEPILNASCTGSTAPCHRDDGNGVALGNLDVSSFEAIHQRPDLLRRHGSYPEPMLLIKAVSSQGMMVPYGDKFYPLEIEHTAGAILSMDSDAFFTLKTWLDHGATENGLPPTLGEITGTGPCNTTLPQGVDISSVTGSEPGFAEFDDVQRYLVDSCGAGSCHGTAAPTTI